MSATSWEVAGLVVHSPVTAATNVLLAIECVWLASRPGPVADAPRTVDRAYVLWRGRWRRFLLWTAVGAATGALKHALSDGSESAPMQLARLVSNASTGAAALHGTLAVVAARCRRRRAAVPLERAAVGLFLAFLAVTAADPRFLWVVAASATFLAPVLVVELVAWRLGNVAAGWIFGGLLVSTLTGGVYLARLSAGPWLDQNDIAHLIALAACAAVHRGARLDPAARVGRRTRPARGRTLEATCPSL